MQRKMQRHGLTKDGKVHPIYNLRKGMLERCYSIPETKHDYNSYRGKGIKVCDEWTNDITSFYNWCMSNGWAKGLVIDRIDPAGNYEPINCRFLTKSENSKKVHIDHPRFGRDVLNAKLSDEEVVIIKKLLDLGFQGKAISKLFEVGENSISVIKNNKGWKHIKLEDELCHQCQDRKLREQK